MFRFEPIDDKPHAYRVFRDIDEGKQWHPSDMMKRFYDSKEKETGTMNTVAFYADAYKDDHLKPDEWETDVPEQELDDFILFKIAERLGVDRIRVRFESPTSEIVLLDGERVGEVIVSN
jgi:hypothetical protein